MAGLITTSPVLVFAGVGAGAPRLSRSLGSHRLLVFALLAGAVGLAARPLGTSPIWFSLLSVLALTGGAVANVLLPTLVKEHFPDRMGAMTSLYTTTLAIGITAAAGLTVPIG